MGNGFGAGTELVRCRCRGGWSGLGERRGCRVAGRWMVFGRESVSNRGDGGGRSEVLASCARLCLRRAGGWRLRSGAALRLLAWPQFRPRFRLRAGSEPGPRPRLRHRPWLSHRFGETRSHRPGHEPSHRPRTWLRFLFSVPFQPTHRPLPLHPPQPKHQHPPIHRPRPRPRPRPTRQLPPPLRRTSPPRRLPHPLTPVPSPTLPLPLMRRGRDCRPPLPRRLPGGQGRRSSVRR